MALFVVGYLEFIFLQEIFNFSKKWSFATVCLLESFKGVAIYLHRFIEYYNVEMPQHLKMFLKIGRTIALIFSFIVGLAKVSEGLDNTKKIATLRSIEYNKIDTSYSSENLRLIMERNMLLEKIQTFDSGINKSLKRNTERLFKIIDTSKLEFTKQAILKANEIQKNNSIETNRYTNNRLAIVDSLIYNSQYRIKDEKEKFETYLKSDTSYAQTQNSTMVGTYEVFKIILPIKPNTFFKIYIIIIATLLSFLLELVIINCFNYVSYIFFNESDPKEIDNRMKN